MNRPNDLNLDMNMINPTSRIHDIMTNNTNKNSSHNEPIIIGGGIPNTTNNSNY